MKGLGIGLVVAVNFSYGCNSEPQIAFPNSALEETVLRKAAASGSPTAVSFSMWSELATPRTTVRWSSRASSANSWR